MKDVKDVLLFLQNFDEEIMFDFENNIKLYFVSDMLRSIMCRGI